MLRVLLADDDQVFRHALRRYLQALDYEVAAAIDLDLHARCCDPHSSAQVDVAVIGVDPHGLDSTVVRALMRCLRPEVPVLLLVTNLPAASVAGLLTEASVQAVVTKPALLQQVEATLRRITGGGVADWRSQTPPCPHRGSGAALAAAPAL